jgi:amino acid permease
LIASTLVIKYWFDQRGYVGPASHPALYVALFLAVIIAINYFGVGIFGEFEFWLSSVKVLIILGLIIFTLVIASGGGAHDHPKGFHYWSEPGAFAAYPGLSMYKQCNISRTKHLLTLLQKEDPGSFSRSGVFSPALFSLSLERNW